MKPHVEKFFSDLIQDKVEIRKGVKTEQVVTPTMTQQVADVLAERMTNELPDTANIKVVESRTEKGSFRVVIGNPKETYAQVCLNSSEGMIHLLSQYSEQAPGLFKVQDMEGVDTFSTGMENGQVYTYLPHEAFLDSDYGPEPAQEILDKLKADFTDLEIQRVDSPGDRRSDGVSMQKAYIVMSYDLYKSTQQPSLTKDEASGFNIKERLDDIKGAATDQNDATDHKKGPGM